MRQPCPANRLNNGPGAVEPQALVQVPDNAQSLGQDYDASSEYYGNVAAFLNGSGVLASQLTGTATTISLTSPIDGGDDLWNYYSCTTPVTDIKLGSGTNTVTLNGTYNNCNYNWNGTDGKDTFNITGAYGKTVTGGNEETTFNVSDAGAATTELIGGSGKNTFNFTAAFAGEAKAGESDDNIFNFNSGGFAGTVTGADEGYKATFNIKDASIGGTIQGGAGEDTFNILVDVTTNPLTISGGEGKDSFVVGDGSAGAACEYVTLEGGAGDDKFTFKDNAAFEGTANGGDGDDTFTFNGAPAAGTFDGGNGDDTVVINYNASGGLDLNPSADGSTAALFKDVENVSFDGGKGKLDLSVWASEISVNTEDATDAVTIITSKAGTNNITLGDQVDTIVISKNATIANQAELNITGFGVGAKSDVLDVTSFGLAGGEALVSTDISGTAISGFKTKATVVNGQHYTEDTAKAAIASLTGVTASDEAIFIMQGDDYVNFVYYVKATGTTIADNDVTLLGTVTADGDLAQVNIVTA